MRRFREQARRWVSRELVVKLQQRGPAAIAVKSAAAPTMTDAPARLTVVAIRPSFLTAGIGFVGSTIAVTVLMIALSQI